MFIGDKWVDNGKDGCKGFESCGDGNEPACGSCNHLRSNCGEEDCKECAGIDVMFYCSIDRLEV
jgi:hypothetical protein